MVPLQGRPSHGTACFACVAAAHSQHHPPRICTQAAPQPASQTHRLCTLGIWLLVNLASSADKSKWAGL